MTVITIGKRLVPVEQIALVEPYDPAANPRIKTERQFQARIILIDRDSVLTEDAPAAFAEANGFPMLAEDQTALNPAVAFFVETSSRPRASSRASPTPRACAGAIATARSKASCCLPSPRRSSPSRCGASPIPRRPGTRLRPA
jgi:hypothetical protein